MIAPAHVRAVSLIRTKWIPLPPRQPFCSTVSVYSPHSSSYFVYLNLHNASLGRPIWWVRSRSTEMMRYLVGSQTQLAPARNFSPLCLLHPNDATSHLDYICRNVTPPRERHEKSSRNAISQQNHVRY